MDNNEKLVVEFEPITIADILVSAQLCEVEISGFAKVERQSRRFGVSGEALIFKQTCSLARTEPDTDAICLWQNEIVSSGDEEKIKDMESQSLWWHSHVNSPVYFSSQDWSTIRNLVSGYQVGNWLLSIVVNKENKYLLALSENNNGFIRYEEVALILNPEISTDEFRALFESRKDHVRKLINERVTIVRQRR